MFPNSFPNNFFNIGLNQNVPMSNYNQINQMPAMMDDYQIQNEINPIQNNNDTLKDDFNIFYKNIQFPNFDNYLNILEDEKKTIILTDPMNEKKITINIPIYFTKNDLYSYVNMDDNEERQQVVLFYNNNILNKDESSIENISDNSIIILFQKPNHQTYRDSSLYKYICKLYPSNSMLNIMFKFSSKYKSLVYLPENVPMYLMLNFIKIVFDLKKDEVRLLYNGSEININYIDDIKIITFFKANNPEISIVEYNVCRGVSDFVGREIKVIIFYKNKNIFKSRFVNKYDTIGSLYDIFLQDLTDGKIFYKTKELKRDDKHSLVSLGIKGDFECYIE